MLVVTANSTYRVEAQGTHFVVTKVAESKPARNHIGIGWTCMTNDIYIRVGFGAQFGSLYTSKVLTVTQGGTYASAN
jgi:hypothetical protein